MVWSRAYLDFVAEPGLSASVAAVARIVCVAAADCLATPVLSAAVSLLSPASRDSISLPINERDGWLSVYLEMPFLDEHGCAQRLRLSC